MKKIWFLNVAGGAVLLTVVAVTRPFSAEKTATCKPACENACQASEASTRLDFTGLLGQGNASSALGTACCATTCATGDVTTCPPIWLLQPADPINVFGSRITPLESQMAPDPAQPQNLLVLNGKSFDFSKFRRTMQGPLELVDGLPDAPGSKSVPFTAWLVRGGQPLKNGFSNPDQSVLLLNVSELLKLAKPGDHLQILPARDAVKGFNFCLSGGC